MPETKVCQNCSSDGLTSRVYSSLVSRQTFGGFFGGDGEWRDELFEVKKRRYWCTRGHSWVEVERNELED